MAAKKSYEHIPMNEGMYKKSQELTDSIYRVTIKDEEEGQEGGRHDERVK